MRCGAVSSQQAGGSRRSGTAATQAFQPRAAFTVPPAQRQPSRAPAKPHPRGASPPQAVLLGAGLAGAAGPVVGGIPLLAVCGTTHTHRWRAVHGCLSGWEAAMHSRQREPPSSAARHHRQLDNQPALTGAARGVVVAPAAVRHLRHTQRQSCGRRTAATQRVCRRRLPSAPPSKGGCQPTSSTSAAVQQCAGAGSSSPPACLPAAAAPGDPHLNADRTTHAPRRTLHFTQSPRRLRRYVRAQLVQDREVSQEAQLGGHCSRAGSGLMQGIMQGLRHVMRCMGWRGDHAACPGTAVTASKGGQTHTAEPLSVTELAAGRRTRTHVPRALGDHP